MAAGKLNSIVGRTAAQQCRDDKAQTDRALVMHVLRPKLAVWGMVLGTSSLLVSPH